MLSVLILLVVLPFVLSQNPRAPPPDTSPASKTSQTANFLVTGDDLLPEYQIGGFPATPDVNSTEQLLMDRLSIAVTEHAIAVARLGVLGGVYDVDYASTAYVAFTLFAVADFLTMGSDIANIPAVVQAARAGMNGGPNNNNNQYGPYPYNQYDQYNSYGQSSTYSNQSSFQSFNQSTFDSKVATKVYNDTVYRTSSASNSSTKVSGVISESVEIMGNWNRQHNSRSSMRRIGSKWKNVGTSGSPSQCLSSIMHNIPGGYGQGWYGTHDDHNNVNACDGVNAGVIVGIALLATSNAIAGGAAATLAQAQTAIIARGHINQALSYDDLQLALYSVRIADRLRALGAPADATADAAASDQPLSSPSYTTWYSTPSNTDATFIIDTQNREQIKAAKQRARTFPEYFYGTWCAVSNNRSVIDRFWSLVSAYLGIFTFQSAGPVSRSVWRFELSATRVATSLETTSASDGQVLLSANCVGKPLVRVVLNSTSSAGDMSLEHVTSVGIRMQWDGDVEWQWFRYDYVNDVLLDVTRRNEFIRQ